MPKEFLEGVTICYADSIEDVYEYAFTDFKKSTKVVSYPKLINEQEKEALLENNIFEKIISESN